jgi:hypothetical protein
MSAKYQIKKEIGYIKWMCRNNLIKCEDKLNPIYESIVRIEEELSNMK